MHTPLNFVLPMISGRKQGPMLWHGWRSIPTGGSIPLWADEELATCTVQRASDEHGQLARVLSTDPLVLFNNPAVAIELGFTIILKHLVEEVGIDTNAHAWCSYTASIDDGLEPMHLLAVANTFDHAVGGSEPSFNYLLSREETNVHVPMVPNGSKYVWHAVYENENCTCKNFRSLVEHSSFEPNRFNGDTSHMALLFAFVTAFVTARLIEAYTDNPASADMLVRKFKILLDVGADPELVMGDGGETVLEFNKLMLRQFQEADTNPLGVQVGPQMIEAMEEKIASGNGSE